MAELKKKRVKLKDIAVKAEVSVSLVSRVLNNNMGNTSASPEIVDKIKATASKMGYSPDIRARSLRTGKTNTIAVIMTMGGNFSMSIYTNLLKGIVDGGSSTGYQFIYQYFKNEDEELYELNILKKMNVDGLLYAPSPGFPLKLQDKRDKVIDELIEFGIKVILCMEKGTTSKIYSNIVDDFSGGRIAAEYMLENVVENAVCFSCNMDDRINGVVDTLRDSGVKVKIVECSSFEFDAGYTAAMECIKNGMLVKGIFAVCDLVAQGVCQAIEDSGMRVDDFIIVGYDGLDARKYFKYQIPSVKQPAEEIGKKSVKSLIDMLKGKVIESSTFLPVLEI